jgi:hypothetical protein
MSIGRQVAVVQGQVSNLDGISCGGSYRFPAANSKPESVELALWDGRSTERDVTLSVGDTFEFSGQTWRLDEVSDEGRAWDATLTRIA